MNAIACGVKFFDIFPYALAVFFNGHLVAHDALPRKVRNMLRVMQESYCIVIAA